MSKVKRVALAIVVAATLLSPQTIQACPNCKEALAAQTGDGARLKDGYFYSILLMMAMPFSLLGTGAFFVVRAVRKGSFPEI